jgi:hypothetical protein
MMLPTEYRRNGVNTGDLGILYRTGDFAFLFNIFLPSDHEINRGRVPDRFISVDKFKLETAIKGTSRTALSIYHALGNPTGPTGNIYTSESLT